MKKIYNGHLYNTDTAKKLGEDGYSNRGDFNFWEETLYRTKSGEYFIYGVGGAESRYAEQVEQNSWCGGSRINPISEDGAKMWAEDHLSVDDYERAFGKVEENTVQISAAIDPDLKSKMEKIKCESGETTDEFISRIIGEVSR